VRGIENTSEPWRVGVLFSQSGFMAVIEETQLRGTLTAIDEINAAGGVNGRPLEPVIYDPASEAKAFGRYARRLMIEDGVTTMFGGYTSSSRRAMLPVVERLNGLLWYPTLYEGFEFSPNVIYTGAAPNQNSVELCRLLMDLYGRRFFFIGSDYVYPRESNRIMGELVRNSGGEVVGERYLRLSADRSEFLPLLREVKAAQPDVIFSTVVGDSTVFLYQTYHDMGFNPKVMPIASLTTTEAEVQVMGYDVGEGISPRHLISRASAASAIPPLSSSIRSATGPTSRPTCVWRRRIFRCMSLPRRCPRPTHSTRKSCGRL
jgi:ABC-type branched-subunit amino acid transport system substrate-binding protein